VAVFALAGGCEQQSTATMTTQTARTPLAAPAPASAVSPQFTIGNQRYVFDVSDHTPEELMAVLRRASEISQLSNPDFSDLNIALVLHGPDMAMFARRNYDQHKELVDLAARLDAFDIIDFKICETAMGQLGYSDDDFPAFLERVPYAPEELKRLKGEGYVTL
jgi:hypothetical protein